MPIFEFTCLDCGAETEALVASHQSNVECSKCGSANLKKNLSVPSSLSGTEKSSATFADSGACCGMNPGEAGCPGPGSCCAKAIA